MHRTPTAIFAAFLIVIPALAGALLLEVADPQANPEARARHAIVVARTTACMSPEKTTVTATAEGIVNGQRRSIPLKVMNLATPGTFAVAREWPENGAWIVQLVATNPDYKDYATYVVVPIRNNTFSREGAKQFFHRPSDDDVNSVLRQATLE